MWGTCACGEQMQPVQVGAVGSAALAAERLNYAKGPDDADEARATSRAGPTVKMWTRALGCRLQSSGHRGHKEQHKCNEHQPAGRPVLAQTGRWAHGAQWANG
jgi:hypothetical protein